MSYKYNPLTDTVEMVTSEQDLYDFFSTKGFFFSKNILTRYYLSLKSKPFVILSGISGTGKTKIAQLFADYICQHDEKDVEKRKRIAFVPVRPDWMDNKGLLGYFNMLDEQYHATRLLELLLDARESPETPFFVILDEMNIAKVEHYFSDFLSVLESRTPDNPEGEQITLHPLPEAETATGRKVPNALHVPANIFFTGTVNIDESTYMFSPKVLDRANVIEFNDVDLAAYSGHGSRKGEKFILADSRVYKTFFLSDPEKSFCRKEDYMLMDGHAQNLFEKLQAILTPHHLHFGYRVANEMGRFVTLSLNEVGDSSLYEAVDVQIMQKVLPKLHGTRAKLEKPLQELLAFCHGTDTVFSEELLNDNLSDKKLFPYSFKKISRMLEELHLQGYTSFIE